jgi:hypothetical protein
MNLRKHWIEGMLRRDLAMVFEKFFGREREDFERRLIRLEKRSKKKGLKERLAVMMEE